MTDQTRWITRGEAMRRLRMGPQTLRRLLDQGEIKFQRGTPLHKRQYLLREEDVERLRQYRPDEAVAV